MSQTPPNEPNGPSGTGGNSHGGDGSNQPYPGGPVPQWPENGQNQGMPPGRGVYGENRRRPRKGLILGLSIGGGVVLIALVAILALVLTGVLGGAKVKDSSDFEDKLQELGSEQGADRCENLDDTLLKSIVKKENFADDAKLYVCSNIDLTSLSDLSGADEGTKLILGAYSEKESDLKSTMKDELDTTAMDQNPGEWGLSDDHWAAIGNAGSEKDAQKKLGGDTW